MANDVNILLNARNNASGAIKQVQTDLRGLGGAASAASSGLSALAGAFTVGAVVAGVTALGGAMVDLANGAAKLETLRNSFDGLAAGVGQSSADMLESLRQASRGMISDADLLLSANKAMLLGVADTADEMTALMQIAMQRGAAMGLSTTQAFNDIVTGLGRGSALILDNLGIVVDAEANNEAYAASIGKVASALTEQEKKQALINAVMREAAGAAGDATSSLSEQAVAIGSMGAAWQNLKDQLGTLVSPAVATAMQGLADALNTVNTAIADARPTEAENNYRNLTGQLKPLEMQLENVNAELLQWESLLQGGASLTADEIGRMAELRGKAAELATQLAELRQEQGAAAYEASGLTEQVRALAGTYPAAGSAAREAAGGISAATQALLDQMAKLNTVGSALDAYTGKLRGMAAQLAGVIGVGGALASLKAEEEQIKKNVAAYEAMGWSSQQIALVVQTTGDQVAGQWQEIIDAPAKAAAEAEKAARQGASAYQKMMNDAQAAYDSFVGRVQGVLQGGLSLDGINVDDMLPREDAINENARRLAAIANEGLIGQDWLEEFKREVPDIYAALVDSGDPKAAAANLLRDFQDGLVPDLLDKERAKELVKRALIGDANMAALAQEIAAELAQEMGTSLQQAQAAAYSALGVKAPDGAGGIGDAAAAELNNEQTLQGMARAGVEAAATWGAAFLDKVAQGVPGELIAMLTTLITPQVQANIQAAQTQAAAQ